MFTKSTISAKQFFIAGAILFISLFSGIQSFAATWTLPGKGNPSYYKWSDIQNGVYPGIGPISATDNIVVDKKAWLIIDVTNAVCNELDLGTAGKSADWATLEIKDGMKLTVSNLITSNVSKSKQADIIFGIGSGTPSTGGGELVCAGFTGPNFDIQSNGGKITVTGSGPLPSSVIDYNDLIVNLPNATDNLDLTVTITIHGSLQLINGRLNLNDYNVTMAAASTISGGSDDSYVKISGTGMFKAKAVANVAKTFPVGFNPYMPITVKLPSGATATDFTVGVRSGVENLTGTITDHAVGATWSLIPSATVNNAIISLGWDGDVNQTNFNPARSFMLLRASTGLWTAMDPSTVPVGTDISSSSNGISDYILTNITGQTFTGSVPYTIAVGDDAANFQTNVPLPVEFISFTATKQGADMAILNFSTAWEVNNAGFEVERSTNGISWNKVGFVPGNGNTSEVKNYAFATSLSNINSAVVYYRLKQVDFNGQFEYSATRTIRLSAAAAKATSVYPNPATNRISVSLEGVAAGEMAKIAVMDMSGKIIISANHLVEEGNFTLDMNLDQLTKGNYIVSISSPSSNFNTKLVKF